MYIMFSKKKRSSFSDLLEYFQIYMDMLQICPDNFQVVSRAPLS